MCSILAVSVPDNVYEAHMHCGFPVWYSTVCRHISLHTTMSMISLLMIFSKLRSKTILLLHAGRLPLYETPFPSFGLHNNEEY